MNISIWWVLIYWFDCVVIIIIMPMFMVLWSWHCHCESSPGSFDSRVTQGLEAPPRTSTSHLATDHGSRPSAAQSRSELSLATCSGPRTMEATFETATLQSGACPRWWWWFDIRWPTIFGHSDQPELIDPPKGSYSDYIHHHHLFCLLYTSPSPRD